jgi:hypothetical protein
VQIVPGGLHPSQQERSRDDHQEHQQHAQTNGNESKTRARRGLM